jgi:TIR domain/Pentapeptide repeats (8 copies)
LPTLPAHYQFLKRAEVKLSHARLRQAALNDVGLIGANLTAADLTAADLNSANLTAANLGSANLTAANLSWSELSRANLSEAICWYTLLSDVELSDVAGLDSIIHKGPSTIGTDTLFSSKGKVPEEFLRGCGVPDALIAYLHSQIGSMNPIHFYSCFISYSAKDTGFAERLHADLQREGVRCWYAPEDLKIGEKIRVGIDDSIRVHDKLLLVLSKNSVQSEWVEKEVETAMEQERRLKRTILFPIRLDDAVLKIDSGWPADIRRSRHIGDFRRWKTHDAYQKPFDRLLRDLRASEEDK